VAHDEFPNIKPDAVLATARRLHVAHLDGAVAVLDQNSELCHVLGGASCAIWSLIDGQRTVAEIINECGAQVSR
jgi:hypothetical protein